MSGQWAKTKKEERSSFDSSSFQNKNDFPIWSFVRTFRSIVLVWWVNGQEGGCAANGKEQVVGVFSCANICWIKGLYCLYYCCCCWFLFGWLSHTNWPNWKTTKTKCLLWLFANRRTCPDHIELFTSHLSQQTLFIVRLKSFLNKIKLKKFHLTFKTLKHLLRRQINYHKVGNRNKFI